MVKVIFSVTLLLLLIGMGASAAVTVNSSASAGGRGRYSSDLGLRVPETSIAVDALYDSRLDTLVSGYRQLTVTIVNESQQKLFLDPEKDHWVLNDADGKNRTAAPFLPDKALWEGLDPRLKEAFLYPRWVNPKEQVIFSLFFRDLVSIADFRSLSFYSSYLKATMTYYSPGIPWPKTESALP